MKYHKTALWLGCGLDSTSQMGLSWSPCRLHSVLIWVWHQEGGEFETSLGLVQGPRGFSLFVRVTGTWERPRGPVGKHP